jgi:peptide/nickel transport system substrate-binding protein
VNDEQIIQAIAQMLARVGIAAKVVAMPVSIFMTRAQKLDFSVALLGWGVSTGEASYPLRALAATWSDLKGNGTYNLGRYSNAKVDELLTTALATIDNVGRERLLQQATELVIRDYGIIPLHFQVNTWAMRKPLTYQPRMDERTYAHTVRPGK